MLSLLALLPLLLPISCKKSGGGGPPIPANFREGPRANIRIQGNWKTSDMKLITSNSPKAKQTLDGGEIIGMSNNGIAFVDNETVSYEDIVQMINGKPDWYVNSANENSFSFGWGFDELGIDGQYAAVGIRGVAVDNNTLLGEYAVVIQMNKHDPRLVGRWHFTMKRQPSFMMFEDSNDLAISAGIQGKIKSLAQHMFDIQETK